MLSGSPLALVRLARPIARRPLMLAVVASVVCALSGLGFLRFAVDAGTGLLVGSSSTPGKTYTSFSHDFGADPIVIVLSAASPQSIYTEANVTRLASIEQDLAHYSRDQHSSCKDGDPPSKCPVASVLGPGTIAVSSLKGINDQISIVTSEYGTFVEEVAVADYIQSNKLDITKLTSDQATAIANTAQSAKTAAERALATQVVVAAANAEQARAAADAHQAPTDKVLDTREKAAQQAVDGVSLPPFFAAFVNTLEGKSTDAGEADARRLFDNFAAAYGICDQNIARTLGVGSSCQSFIARFLLDLPNCPAINSGKFCKPKPQWAAALPPQQTGQPEREVITLRLRPEVVGDGAAVRDVLDFIKQKFANRTPRGATSAFIPISCGDRAAAPTSKTPFTCVVAGAPLLAQGVVSATTHLLFALFPVAVLVMLLILIGTFRVRGRAWPLAAAGLAALVTLGLTLAFGISVTPAVLAGVPVLVGLGVDYAVQLVARLAEERRRGLGVEASLRQVLEHTGPATLAAALATLAGLLTLGVIAGVDLGPLVAVPLVAEFALVLVGGIIFAWLSALFIALPAAAWRERRLERMTGRPAPAPTPSVATSAPRTALLATRWRAVLVPGALLALFGWIALARVPVQTDVEKLLAPSLSELQAVQTVRAQTGAANELDLYVQGDVAGPAGAKVVPDNVEWQAGVAACVLADRPDVAQAVSIGDVLRAGASTPASSATVRCPAQPSPAPSPTPSPSASASPSPSPSVTPSQSPSTPESTTAPAATPTPTSVRRPGSDAVRAARSEPVQPDAQSPEASPPASPAPATPSAVPSPTAPQATPAPTTLVPPLASQTSFICTLRTFPQLSRVLVSGFSLTTQPCPAIDIVRRVGPPDPSPVDPRSARIVLGVRDTSAADESKLVDALRAEAANPPGGISVQPTGLAALGVSAYNTLTGRALFLNLVPIALVALVLFAIHREPRRALLPVLPTLLAAGWAPLVVATLGRLPRAGDTLGALNPLTVVLGALVVALATEFGVVLLGRFYEERARGLDPDQAAAATLSGVGRAVGVSAATLAAGFAVLAVSGLVPGGQPLIADFGLEVVIDLGLAILAVFAVMLPLAVAIERTAPAPVALAAPAAAPAEARFRPVERDVERARRGTARSASGVAPPPTRELPPVPVAPTAVPPLAPVPAAPPERVPETVAEAPPAPVLDEPPPPRTPPEPPAPAPSAGSALRRLPGLSGRLRPPAPPPSAAPTEAPRRRLPGLSGRRRSPSDAAPPETSPAPPAPPPPAATPPAAPSPPQEEPPERWPEGRLKSRRRRPPPHIRRRQPPES